jgi:hypothetical protein
MWNDGVKLDRGRKDNNIVPVRKKQIRTSGVQIEIPKQLFRDSKKIRGSIHVKAAKYCP